MHEHDTCEVTSVDDNHVKDFIQVVFAAIAFDKSSTN